MHTNRERSAWWREPMLWLVVGGPLAVVLASVVTAVIAWRGADPVISEPAAQRQAPALAPAVDPASTRLIWKRIVWAPAPRRLATCGGICTLTGSQRACAGPTSKSGREASVAPARPSTRTRKRCTASVVFMICRR